MSSIRKVRAGLGISLVILLGLAVGCGSSQDADTSDKHDDAQIGEAQEAISVACGCTCSDGGGATGAGTGTSRSNAVEAAYKNCRFNCFLRVPVRSYDNCTDLAFDFVEASTLAGPLFCNNINSPLQCALVCQNNGYRCFNQQPCPSGEQYGCYCGNDC